MSERTPEEHPLSDVLQTLQKSNRPISRWCGTSLQELYQEGQSSLVRLKGPQNMDTKYYPKAFRIIALQEGEFKGVSLILENTSAETTEVLARELRKEVNELPDVGKLDNQTDSLVRGIFSSEAIQTVAALELDNEIQTNQRIVQVLYPRLLRTIFRNLFDSLGMPMPELMEREVAASIAIKYLKSIPFHALEPRILAFEELRPNNQEKQP